MRHRNSYRIAVQHITFRVVVLPCLAAYLIMKTGKYRPSEVAELEVSTMKSPLLPPYPLLSAGSIKFGV
jgi:hypothetical protein